MEQAAGRGIGLRQKFISLCGCTPKPCSGRSEGAPSQVEPELSLPELSSAQLCRVQPTASNKLVHPRAPSGKSSSSQLAAQNSNNNNNSNNKNYNNYNSNNNRAKNGIHSWRPKQRTLQATGSPVHQIPTIESTIAPSLVDGRRASGQLLPEVEGKAPARRWNERAKWKESGHFSPRRGRGRSSTIDERKEG